MSIDKQVLQVSYLVMEAAIYPSGWHFKTAQTKTKAIPPHIWRRITSGAL